MTRACVLALAVAGCLAPTLAEAQARASTIFRGGAKHVTGGSPAVARSANSGLGFRGFRGAVPFFGGGFGSAYGYGNDGNLLYRLGQIPVPPYFALHPPVYYSRPISRPYGDSPFARQPAPASHYDVNVKPAVVINPYYKKAPEKTKDAAWEKTASKPHFIANPFYTPRGIRLAQTEATSAVVERNESGSTGVLQNRYWTNSGH